MLKAKKIVIGITGSIAAYKIPMLVRGLIKQGAEVKVVMTPAAADFVSPLVLSTLSKNEVIVELATNNQWANHVQLGRWADLLLIAPASCNTLAKMASGQCDNLLLAVYLSATCPVMIAPAMDEDMWKHPSTKQNITILQSYNHTVLPVEKGELASGLIGEGRMAEPESILSQIEIFFRSGSEFKGKKVLVTAGPTYEAIDPVRFIGNHSSGKMGIAIAEEFSKRGAEVVLVLGPSAQQTSTYVKKVIRVQSAEEMYNICIKEFTDSTIAVMAAAVADYTPVKVENQKIKKAGDTFTINLKKTKDILSSLGKLKKKKQILIGFALETNNEKENAIGKLKAKNADAIILNSLKDANAGFGYDTNKITIYDHQNKEHTYPVKSKKDVAKDIVDFIKRKVND
jgi:phosphopantothenoylcysteine decarboxylase / phosphopantothenate---cysteine ligase